jgi:HlyD family secretion protein
MGMALTEARTDGAPAQAVTRPPALAPSRIPTITVVVVTAAVASPSLCYLMRGEALLAQGEVDATHFDIAARVDGRVGDVLVARGQNIAGNMVLMRIDNPETIAKHEQAVAAKLVADAQLANINIGTRPEVIAARKAALEPDTPVWLSR